MKFIFYLISWSSEQTLTYYLCRFQKKLYKYEYWDNMCVYVSFLVFKRLHIFTLRSSN